MRIDANDLAISDGRFASFESTLTRVKDERGEQVEVVVVIATKPDDTEVVVVTGTRNPQRDNNFSWIDSYYEDGYMTSEDIAYSFEQAAVEVDMFERTVTNNLTGPLTVAQERALQALKDRIKVIDAFMENLNPNTLIRFSDGRVIWASELQAIWARVDFTVSNAATNHSPGSAGGNRGAADWNGGDPIINLNIDVMTGYNSRVGGMDFLILHELGHFSMWQRQQNDDMYNPSGPDGTTRSDAENLAHESEANSIARAMATILGLQPYGLIPDFGYAPGVEIITPQPQPVYEPFYPPLPSLPDNDYR